MEANDTRLGRIVRLLSDNATIVISGTRIAEELCTSRSEVWRAVQQLRELGRADHRDIPQPGIN